MSSLPEKVDSDFESKIINKFVMLCTLYVNDIDFMSKCMQIIKELLPTLRFPNYRKAFADSIALIEPREAVTLAT